MLYINKKQLNNFIIQLNMSIHYLKIYKFKLKNRKYKNLQNLQRIIQNK